MARFMIAGAHKSSGKTVISTGLAAALTGQGDVVQCFKKGPDYIDPMWLSAASGRPCYNLDFNTMSAPEFTALMCAHSQDADIAMIEANKGLYDGVKLDGSDANSALAKVTQTPVILVIDTTGMTRGIAPLLQGYLTFDDVNIAGLILNKVGGPRHEGKLRAAVEAYTDIPVIGAVGRNDALDIGERHLGLTTPSETEDLDAKIAQIAEIVGGQIDLDQLKRIAATAPAVKVTPPPAVSARFEGLRIAYARDRAFGFYYADDLDAFAALGAELVPFNALSDQTLPDVDGLFLGGGFPETQMAALSANTALRGQIKQQIAAGMPVYAECGGLMYLCRSMAWRGETHPMCDVVGADAVMCERPQGRGLVQYTTTPDHIWAPRDGVAKAHEFHYARLDNVDADTKYGRALCRGHGVDGAHDGIVVGNVLAGFCHQRNSQDNPWVARFLDFVQRVKVAHQA